MKRKPNEHIDCEMYSKDGSSYCCTGIGYLLGSCISTHGESARKAYQGYLDAFYAEELTQERRDDHISADICAKLSEIDIGALANKINLKALGGEIDHGALANVIAAELDLEDLAQNINLGDLAREFQACDIAAELNLDDLAGVLDLETLADQIDFSELVLSLNLEHLAVHITKHLDYKKLAEAIFKATKEPE